MKNILQATKNLHYICHIFGITSYVVREISGNIGLVKSKSKILMKLQTFLLFTLSVASILFTVDSYKNIKELHTYVQIINVIFYLLTSIHITIFGYFKQRDLIIIWTKFYNICRSLENLRAVINYEKVKLFCNFVIFILYFTIFVYFCVDVYNWIESEETDDIYIMFCTLICTAIEFKMLVIIYLIYMCSKYLNSVLANVQNLSFYENVMKTRIRDYMMLHNELLDIGNIVNNVFKLLFLRIISIWFSLSFTAFTLAANINKSKNVLHAMDYILWTICGTLNMFLICLCSELAKFEVSL